MLNEREIMDRLGTSLRAAIQHCEDLARAPRKGRIYRELRDELKLIEGAARQAGHYREDMRWMVVGMKMAVCHQKAGDWLRSYAPQKYFLTLAEALRKIERHTSVLRDAKTGRLGPILPKVQALHRDTRPEGWRASASGLLLPA